MKFIRSNNTIYCIKPAVKRHLHLFLRRRRATGSPNPSCVAAFMALRGRSRLATTCGCKTGRTASASPTASTVCPSRSISTRSRPLTPQNSPAKRRRPSTRRTPGAHRQRPRALRSRRLAVLHTLDTFRGHRPHAGLGAEVPREVLVARLPAAPRSANGRRVARLRLGPAPVEHRKETPCHPSATRWFPGTNSAQPKRRPADAFTPRIPSPLERAHGQVAGTPRLPDAPQLLDHGWRLTRHTQVVTCSCSWAGGCFNIGRGMWRSHPPANYPSPLSPAQPRSLPPNAPQFPPCVPPMPPRGGRSSSGRGQTVALAPFAHINAFNRSQQGQGKEDQPQIFMHLRGK
jgi:hypothetical protein